MKTSNEHKNKILINERFDSIKGKTDTIERNQLMIPGDIHLFLTMNSL